MSKQDPSYRFAELIQAFGGVEETRIKLMDYGFSAPRVSTIVGWRRRNSAPGAWALALVEVGQAEGFVTEVRKLRREPKP